MKSDDKIAQQFNTEFVRDPSLEAKGKFNALIEKKDALKAELIEIQDDLELENYVELDKLQIVETELLDTIEELNTVIKDLKDNLKPGSAPREYEVYSGLVNTKLGAVKDLRDQQKMIAGIKVQLENMRMRKSKASTQTTNIENQQVNNITVKMTHEDMVEMMKKQLQEISMAKPEIELDFNLK